MEVHTHTHTPRKKWTHYFWEFLMLFLAVFCGFLAENQREHMIENQRAKKFAASIIEDLQGDTAEIHLNKKTIDSFFQSADMVLSELKKPRSFQNDTILQINGVSGLFKFNYFDPQMGNYEQMKNSGSLRYFKQDLIKMLTRYESDANRLLFVKNSYLNFLNDIITPFIINTLNTDFIAAIKKKEPYKGGSVFMKEPDRATFNQWKNIFFMIRKRHEIEIAGIEVHEKWALELIDELRKTYHLSERTPLEK
jgi:hypothetical protein